MDLNKLKAIKAEYASGVSIEELADKYSVSSIKLKAKAFSEDWDNNIDKLLDSVEDNEHIVQDIAKRKKVDAEKIVEGVYGLKRLDTTLQSQASAIINTVNLMIDGADLKELKTIMEINTKIRQVYFNNNSPQVTINNAQTISSNTLNMFKDEI